MFYLRSKMRAAQLLQTQLLVLDDENLARGAKTCAGVPPVLGGLVGEWLAAQEQPALG